jgi:ABC-type nickel/cobalt efflux system permease component RcnA
VEAHRSYERFEQGHQLTGGEHPLHARTAALLVAVMACFLAVATFLSNETVKEVITGETHRADASAQLESNRVKIDVAEGNATMLRVLGAASPAEEQAAAAARQHETKVMEELAPTDARLGHEIDHHEHEVDDANTKHVDFELGEVGLEVGIVLASVSIIVRRRWLLGLSAAAATAGILLVGIGLLIV